MLFYFIFRPFKTKDGFVAHTRMHDRKNQRIKCKWTLPNDDQTQVLGCQETFCTMFEMQQHLRTVHPGVHQRKIEEKPPPSTKTCMVAKCAIEIAILQHSIPEFQKNRMDDIENKKYRPNIVGDAICYVPIEAIKKKPIKVPKKCKGVREAASHNDWN